MHRRPLIVLKTSRFILIFPTQHDTANDKDAAKDSVTHDTSSGTSCHLKAIVNLAKILPSLQVLYSRELGADEAFVMVRLPIVLLLQLVLVYSKQLAARSRLGSLLRSGGQLKGNGAHIRKSLSIIASRI